MFSDGHLKDNSPGLTAASQGNHKLTQPSVPVLTTQICFNAEELTEPPYFPPENVQTGHGQGKAPRRHARAAVTADHVPDKRDTPHREGSPAVLHILVCPERTCENNGKRQTWEERDCLLCLAH